MNRIQGLSELTLFFVAAVAGIYGFGRAFGGDPIWLGVSATSLILLAKQMARVQARWPSRRRPDHREASRMREPEQGA